MKSILEFGQIMKDAFELSVKNLEEGDICVFLEGVHYNQEDFQIFMVEIDYVNDYIEGFADTLNELDNITFMGDFVTAFKEGQDYINRINEIIMELNQ